MIAPESHPRIRALAREASRKIKRLTNAHKVQIKAIYQDFRTQADALQVEASTKDLTRPGADSLPTETNQEIFSIMTRTISTTVKPLGYYVTVPRPIEEVLGSHFENLKRYEQYTLLAVFANYMAAHANNENLHYTLLDAYFGTFDNADLPEWTKELLAAIEQLSDGTILALTEALVLNLHYTRVVA